MAIRLWQQRVLAAALLGCLPAGALPALAQVPLPVSPATAPAPEQPPAAGPVTVPVRSRGIEMKVRRLPDSVEVVIAGTGPAPQLLQTTRGSSWEGRVLTPAPIPLRMGPQRLSLPEAGLQSISLSGSGNTYSVVVTPVPGFPVGRPVVSADGRDLILSFPASVQPSLQTTSPNVNTPGRVAQPTFVPPLQPRAVAPPVGDMAVGTMLLSNTSYLNVSGPPVTMTLRNAPARDVLMSLAQFGGYGFVYVDDQPGAAGSSAPAGATGAAAAASPAQRPISIAFRNESYGRAINSALLAAGLQGKLEGNMILAGPSALSKSFGAQMSKVYRLNQASADSAADYLANLGAVVNKTFTTTSVSQETQSTGTPTQNTGATQSQTATITQIQSYGASQGPLRGLIGTTDSRLGTITLVGDPRVVAVAEAYLKQLDLRQRQVALSLKILDVDLNNDADIDNSFAIRWGDTFIVNDSGRLIGAFGRNLPSTQQDFGRSVAPNEAVTESFASDSQSAFSSSAGSSSTATFNLRNSDSLTDSTLNNVAELLRARNLNVNITRNSTLSGEASGTSISVQSENENSLTSNATRDISAIIERATGLSVENITTGSTNSNLSRNASANQSSDFTGGRRRNPGSLYPANNFYDFLQAQIVSRTTKLLASPTLILQENPSTLREQGGGSSSNSSQDGQQGITNINLDSPIGRRRANEGVVRVGTNVVTGYDLETPSQGGNVVCTPQLTTAGLVLGARVEKIDDNGFVTFTLSPSISAVTDFEQPPEGCGSRLNILSVRSLDTGAVRVRDGQTLILTGVISDLDREEVVKWPILGDMPIVGQFFRNSGRTRQKRELVIMVTPRIINDTDGGTYGYGWQPGTSQSRELIRSVPR